MRLRFVLPLIPLLLGACQKSTTAVAGDCTLVAFVDGRHYTIAAAVSADRVGPEYVRTVRQRGCEDVIEFGKAVPDALREGDSSFLPNTPLHVKLGEPASTVLLVQAPDGAWHEMLNRALIN